ncbi:MFS transporter [Gorillibacterium sp. sgz500922]|uniref:MFS transporter n=1 Tax=Gorillibacterium sp. sgz500922 TaxID=3446694 RepID=UPI003F673AB1
MKAAAGWKEGNGGPPGEERRQEGSSASAGAASADAMGKGEAVEPGAVETAEPGTAEAAAARSMAGEEASVSAAESLPAGVLPEEGDEEAKVGKSALRELLRNRGYVTLLLASVISRFGDSLDSIAYSWMVYELTGSKALMGILFGVNALPNLLFGPFAGVLVDRWPNKPILIVSDLVRGSLVCTTALLFFTGSLQAWHLFVLTILQSTMETLCSPAEKSLIPDLVSKRSLLAANSYLSTASRISELAGLGAAGVIIALLGISGSILVDGFTFLGSAVILLIGLTRLAPKSGGGEKLTPSHYLHMMKEGLLLIRRNRLLLAAVVTAAFVNFCLVPFNVLIPAYSKDVLQAGPTGLSLLSGGLTVGMIAGGLWMGARGSRYAGSRLIATGLIVIGAMYALLTGTFYLPQAARLAAAVAACFVIGAAVPLAGTPLTVMLQDKTPRAMMGRVMALLSMLCCSAMPLGGWFTAALADLMPMAGFFLIMGGLIVASAVLFRRSTRAF